jgi:hypothetical protein
MAATLELDVFEQIETMPGTTLLRVAARTGPRERIREAPTLVIGAGRRSYQFPALPGSPQEQGHLKIAFLAPTSLLQGELTFRLMLDEQTGVDLPLPTHRGELSLPTQQHAKGAAATLAEARNIVITALEEALADRAALASELESELRQAEDRAARVPDLESELRRLDEHLRRVENRARAQQAKLLNRIEDLEGDLARAQEAWRLGDARPTRPTRSARG